MAEVGEGNPVTNFQKTVGAQNERVKAAEKPLNLVDNLTGTWTNGSIESKYTKGLGGSVHTRINCGGAILDQGWNFDKDGQLVLVSIDRHLTNKYHQFEEASTVTLLRDENGKFQVQKNHTSGLLPEWEKQFHTAKARMATARTRPSTTPPLQK